jgi:abortive infection bacteriophage resistance protein
MRANIAETRGSEQSVTERMRQYISVGMSDRSFIKRKFDATHDQFAAFRKAMKIVPNAAAHAHAL